MIIIFLFKKNLLSTRSHTCMDETPLDWNDDMGEEYKKYLQGNKIWDISF